MFAKDEIKMKNVDENGIFLSVITDVNESTT